jgi:hypothetical protein
MSEGGEALCGPAFHFAEIDRSQRKVYGRKKWMRREVKRRYGPWLEQEARSVAGRTGVLSRRLMRQAIDRLVEVDATRFGKGDWPWLAEALRSELRWALKKAELDSRPHEEDACDRD